MLHLADRTTTGTQKAHLQKPREDNKLRPEDRAAHDWYRFVLSYPAHVVRTYVERFGLGAQHNVLDPFCGTGTTVVECKKLGIPSCGIEPNPMAVFASRTKVDWEVDADQLVAHAKHISKLVLKHFTAEGIEDDKVLHSLSGTTRPSVALRELPPELLKLILTDSISPLPLHKVLIFLEVLEQNREPCLLAHEHLAFAKCLVNEISNLHFGPEIGVGQIKQDAPVVGPWLSAVEGV